MIFDSTIIEGVYTIELDLREDSRGAFARTFCEHEFKTIGFNKHFVQLNHSYNKLKGTLRGLHFQHAPHKEEKLVRCIRGSVIDVVVDLRKHSPTFLKYIKVELSEDNKKMIFIPEGCAHGFQTLVDNTELVYHHTSFYTPIADDGLRYNDPKLGIHWELPIGNISEKDKKYSLIDNEFAGI